jgi:hypothetical protein
MGMQRNEVLDHSVLSLQKDVVGIDQWASIAQTIAQDIRSTDYLFRWGGEEFLLISTDTPLPDLLVLVEKLRARIAQVNWQDIARLPAITCSVGMTIFPDHAHDAETRSSRLTPPWTGPRHRAATGLNMPPTRDNNRKSAIISRKIGL